VAEEPGERIDPVDPVDPRAGTGPSTGPTPGPTIGAGSRLGLALAAFLLLYVGSPGILSPAGHGWLAVPALALWAHVASRPGPRAFAGEAAAAAVGWTLILSWAGKVHWSLLLWIGPGMGLYMAAQGIALRRMVARFPLALAAPAAWMLSETLRAALEPPFGFQWMRLGTWWHAVPWVNQGARLFGIGGLGWVVAALGGLLADAARGWAAGRRPDGVALVSGLAPLALALAGARLAAPGPSAPGPELLLVQPGTAQARKMDPGDPAELMREAVELTRAGLAQARAAGRPPADLVAWGETMLHVPVIDPALAGAMEAGARPAPWALEGLTADRVRQLEGIAQSWVDRGVFGALEPGTAFVAGAEYWTARAGVVRRANAVFLWQEPGRPAGPVSKLHLVPTGETMMGLERFGIVRRVVEGLAGYVPDLLGAEHGDPRALSFRARDGRTYHLGVSICFDNAFDDPFTVPLRRGELDFHLVVSNEAWFELSQEADQMVAFSRLEAIATDRAVVRATNSGVSLALGPRGEELARLVGTRGASPPRDRESAGTLSIQVPVPALGSSQRLTPWVRWARAWSWFWILGPSLLIGASRRKRRGA
jgi:apolipoprotein N-acyltransferase